MKIASKWALDHMEIAAELRAQGANWDTIAQYLGRHKRVLTRWVFNKAEPRATLRNELPRPT